MPLLVQHIHNPTGSSGGDTLTTTKLQQTLSSTSVLFPSAPSTFLSPSIAFTTPATTTNEGTFTIISPHNRTPTLTTIEKGTVTVDPRSSVLSTKHISSTGSLEATTGRTIVPFLTIHPSFSSSSSSGATSSTVSLRSGKENPDTLSANTNEFSNYVFLFGGSKTGNTNHNLPRNEGELLLTNTTMIRNIDNGKTYTFTSPQHDNASSFSSSTTPTDGHPSDTTTVAWPSPRKHSTACCVYKAVSPAQALAQANAAAEAAQTSTEAKTGSKDKKAAPAKGGKTKDSTAVSVVDDAASVAHSHSPPKPSLPSPTIVLFGGIGDDETLYDDLYVCNVDETNLQTCATNSSAAHTQLWTKISTAKQGPAPGARAHHTLTATASSNRVILFGGYGYTQVSAPVIATPVPVTTAPTPSPAKGGKDAPPPSNPVPVISTVPSKPTIPPQLLNDIWVLDCLSWGWTSVLIAGPVPAPRCRHTAVSNAFLADSRMIKNNPFDIMIGLDVRPLLPIYDHLAHLIQRPPQLLPTATGASSLNGSNVTSLNTSGVTSPAPDHPANAKPPVSQSTKGSVKPSGKEGSVTVVDNEGISTAATSALHSGLPSFLIEPNPCGADVLFVFGGACAPMDLATSFAEARKEGNKDTTDVSGLSKGRADDMMDGTVHVLILDASLADAVAATHEPTEKETVVQITEPAPVAVPEPAPVDPKAKGGAPPKGGNRPASAKGSSSTEPPTEIPAVPIRKRPLGAWTTLPAMTYQMLGGASIEISSPDAIELPPGVDTGESVSTVPSILANQAAASKDNSDYPLVPYNGSSTPALTASRPSSRPTSRPASRLTYKSMLRKRNDTYLRRMNAVASTFVLSHPTENDPHHPSPNMSPHDSFASLSSALHSSSSSSENLSYYIFLYGGITDIHVRNAASRLTRKTKGPADDPSVSSLIPVGITLELIDQDALKRRVASPVSTQYDAFGGIILRERQFDTSRGVWTMEIVRRVYPDGSVYEGESDTGVRTGKGKMEWNNVPTISPPSAFLKYTGEWRNDVPHGRGIMYYCDGSVYDGAWSNGVRQGAGTCHWDTHTPYDSAVEDGTTDQHPPQPPSVPHDFAEAHYPVSVVNWAFLSYEGDWYQNVPSGQGTVHYQNGGKYVGALENGIVHGQGELTVYVPSKDIHVTANGVWSNGLLHGNGVWKKEVASDQSLESISQHHRVPGSIIESYQGPFVNGIRDGPDAVVDLEDGSHYRGPYRAGRRNGIAEIRYPNKDVYNGKFVGDKRNGKGTLLKCNGDVYTGLWKDDVMHGEGQYRFTVTGETLLGTWINGRFTGTSNGMKLTTNMNGNSTTTKPFAGTHGSFVK